MTDRGTEIYQKLSQKPKTLDEERRELMEAEGYETQKLTQTYLHPDEPPKDTGNDDSVKKRRKHKESLIDLGKLVEES